MTEKRIADMDFFERVEHAKRVRQASLRRICRQKGHDWYRSVSAPPDTCLRCGAEEDRG